MQPPSFEVQARAPMPAGWRQPQNPLPKLLDSGQCPNAVLRHGSEEQFSPVLPTFHIPRPCLPDPFNIKLQ
eukprot:356269-Chlamydomonas_euryale.AAC.1